MDENALPETVVKDQQEDTSAVKSSESQALPVHTSSATVISEKNEIPKKGPSNQEAQGITNTLSKTLSRDRFSPLQDNSRQIGNRFFNAPVVTTFIRCMDGFVDTSGLIVRRLQRVVEPDTGCLSTCPYLQHYSTCPLISKPPHSEDTVEANDAKEPSAEVLAKKEPECDERKPDNLTSEVDKHSPDSELEQDAEDVNKLISTQLIPPRGSLDILFYFAFTWLVLYPVNALVALLHFLRSLIHDLYDYCQLPNSYVTVVGRRIVSPRRAIRSRLLTMTNTRLLTRANTLFNEMVHLSSCDHSMPFKLSLDSRMSTIRAVPVYETRQATIKRKFSLSDLTDDALISDHFPDNDYVPSSPSLATSSTDVEGSITVSENDLSFRDEHGFLALKEKAKEEELKKIESPTLPAPFKLEPLEI